MVENTFAVSTNAFFYFLYLLSSFFILHTCIMTFEYTIQCVKEDICVQKLFRYFFFRICFTFYRSLNIPVLWRLNIIFFLGYLTSV